MGMNIDDTDYHVQTQINTGNQPINDLSTNQATAQEDSFNQTWLHGHVGLVTGVAFLKDENKLVTSSTDGNLIFWNKLKKTGNLVSSGHKLAISSLVVSPNGRYMLTGGRDCMVKMWDVKNEKAIQTLLEKDRIVSVAWLNDGKHFLMASELTLKLGEFGKFDEEKKVIISFKGANCMAVSKDGLQTLIGFQNGDANLIDINSGEVVRTFKGNSKPVQCVAISPDGQSMVIGTLDGTVTNWKNDNTSLKMFQTNDDVAVWSVSFSPDGTYLAAGFTDGSLKLWNLKQAKLSYKDYQVKLNEATTTGIGCVGFTKDGANVLLGLFNGDSIVLNVKKHIQSVG